MTNPRLLIGALVVATAPLAAQAPSPSPGPSRPAPAVTFAVEVGYVEVDAIVTDRDGQPVRDLKPEDFVVLEDGKPQTIELFTQVDIPYERPEPAAPPPVQPDVRSNARPFEGRLYVIVLDGLHIGMQRTLLARAAARRFLERHFAEGDLAAVVHTSGGASAGQELTGDRRLLLAAVDRLQARMLPSSTLSRIDEYRRTQGMRQQGERVRDPEEMQRGYDARASLDTLKSVADWLSSIRGRRKAVLLLSEGIGVNLYDQINNREASSVMDSLRQATAAAVRANVSFYSVDPRGLGGLSSEMMEIQPVFDDDPALGLNTQGLDSDLRISQDSLRVLAEETSGLASVNTNDFSTAFARLVKDNSAYYVLGYYPPGQRRDGKFHRLEVKVSRPGVRVRARGGYSTPKGREARPPALATRDTPSVLAEMLNSALPRPGLLMELQAAAFAGAGGKAKAVLALEFDGGGFRFTEKDGSFHDTLELSILAVDGSGKVTGANQKVVLDLKPRTRQMVAAGGFRVLYGLDLVPGRYQVRVAARAVNGNTAGSVFYDLDVPEFAKQDLTLSGLVLTSATAGLIPTAGSNPLFKDVLPGPPTTIRRFYPFDRLALMGEIYDGESKAHTLDVVTSLTGADGAVAWRSAEERAIGERKGDTAGAPVVHVAQIPLKEIAPGTYTLRVSVTSRMGKKPKAAERALLVYVLAPPPSPAPAPSPGL